MTTALEEMIAEGRKRIAEAKRQLAAQEEARRLAKERDDIAKLAAVVATVRLVVPDCLMQFVRIDDNEHVVDTIKAYIVAPNCVRVMFELSLGRIGGVWHAALLGGEAPKLYLEDRADCPGAYYQSWPVAMAMARQARETLDRRCPREN